jgi:hypothetical protein
MRSYLGSIDAVIIRRANGRRDLRADVTGWALTASSRGRGWGVCRGRWSSSLVKPCRCWATGSRSSGCRLLVLQVSRNPLLAVLASLPGSAGYLVAGLPAGVIVDRLNPWHALIAGDIIRALAGAGAGLLGGDPRPVFASAGSVTLLTVAIAWISGLRRQDSAGVAVALLGQ